MHYILCDVCAVRALLVLVKLCWKELEGGLLRNQCSAYSCASFMLWGPSLFRMTRTDLVLHKMEMQKRKYVERILAGRSEVD